MATQLEDYLSQKFSAQHAQKFNVTAGLQLIEKSNATLSGVLIDIYKNIAAVHAANQNGGGAGYDGGKDGTVGASNLNRRLMDEAVGDMYVFAIRTSNNIKVGGVAPNFPICLFGVNDFANNYGTLMGPQLAAMRAVFGNIQLAVAFGPAGTVQFTYTLGVDSDIITIGFTGNTTAYSNALNAQNQDKLKWGTRLILYTISDWTNGLAQMQNGILNFSKVGINNNLEQNIISIDSRILSDFFRYDRVEMVFPCQAMSAEAGIVDTILPVPEDDAYFQIKYNIFNAYKGGNVPAQYKKFVEEAYGAAA